MEELKMEIRKANSEVNILVNNVNYKVNVFFSVRCTKTFIDIDKDMSTTSPLDKIKKFILLNVKDEHLQLDSFNILGKKEIGVFIDGFLECNVKVKEMYEELKSIKSIYLRFWTSMKKTLEIENAKIVEMFAKLQEPVMSARNKMLEAMTSFMQQMAKVVSESVQPIFEKMREGAAKLGEAMLNLARSIKIPELTEEEKEKLIESHKKWGKFGWTYIGNAPINFFNTCPETQLEADKEALSYCNEESLQIIFGSIVKFKKKKKDIDEAIDCFSSKHYKACALILFSIIDSIFINMQIGNEKIYTGASAVGAVKGPLKKKMAKRKIFLLTLSYYNITTCFSEVFSDTHNFKDKKTLINRNYLDHGMTNKVVRKKDCIKLFLLLDNLLEFLDFVENKL